MKKPESFNAPAELPKEDTFLNLVGECIGEASVAWSKKGVFDSDLCCDLIHKINNAHLNMIKEGIKDIKVSTYHYHLTPNHTLSQIGDIVIVTPEKKEFG